MHPTERTIADRPRVVLSIEGLQGEELVHFASHVVRELARYVPFGATDLDLTTAATATCRCEAGPPNGEDRGT